MSVLSVISVAVVCFTIGVFAAGSCVLAFEQRQRDKKQQPNTDPLIRGYLERED